MSLEWARILRDLDRIEEGETDKNGRRFLRRAEARGCAGKVIQAAGVAPPPTIRSAAWASRDPSANTLMPGRNAPRISDLRFVTGKDEPGCRVVWKAGEKRPRLLDCAAVMNVARPRVAQEGSF